MIAATVILVLSGVSPLPSLSLRLLENRFSAPGADIPDPTGIIVLGGSVNANLSASRGEIALDNAASRLTSGVALALRYPKARLVFTGGSSDLGATDLDEAGAVHRLWTSLGIPEARMAFENKSRNTFENAIFTRDLVAPKAGETWLLVTSAAHMPRSMGIFRQAKFPVVPYPVDYHTFGDRRDWYPKLDMLHNFDRMFIAGHEFAGLLAYWLTGKTNALFPAP